MNNLIKMTEEFQRQKVKDILAQCTPEQQEKFRRLFPDLRADQLVMAYDLCERTIKKNQSKEST
jgi:hypothetical protein